MVPLNHAKWLTTEQVPLDASEMNWARHRTLDLRANDHLPSNAQGDWHQIPASSLPRRCTDKRQSEPEPTLSGAL